MYAIRPLSVSEVSQVTRASLQQPKQLEVEVKRYNGNENKPYSFMVGMKVNLKKIARKNKINIFYNRTKTVIEIRDNNNLLR